LRGEGWMRAGARVSFPTNPTQCHCARSWNDLGRPWHEQITIEIEERPRKTGGTGARCPSGRQNRRTYMQSVEQNEAKSAAQLLRLDDHQVVLAVLALAEREQHLHQEAVGGALVGDDDGLG
jgi:hypothetical protein